MGAIDLLIELMDKNVSFATSGDIVRWDDEGGNLTYEHLETLKEHKAEVLQFLKANVNVPDGLVSVGTTNGKGKHIGKVAMQNCPVSGYRAWGQQSHKPYCANRLGSHCHNKGSDYAYPFGPCIRKYGRRLVSEQYHLSAYELDAIIQTKEHKLEHKLTIKQEKFCHEYITTGNASEAYRRAYNCEKSSAATIKCHASHLLARDNVSTTIEVLRAKMRKKYDVTVDSLTAELRDVLKLAQETRQAASAVSAIMAIAKLHGLLTDKSKVDMCAKLAITHIERVIIHAKNPQS